MWVLKTYAFCKGQNSQKTILFIGFLEVPWNYLTRSRVRRLPPNSIGYSKRDFTVETCNMDLATPYVLSCPGRDKWVHPRWKISSSCVFYLSRPWRIVFHGCLSRYMFYISYKSFLHRESCYQQDLNIAVLLYFMESSKRCLLLR